MGITGDDETVLIPISVLTDEEQPGEPDWVDEHVWVRVRIDSGGEPEVIPPTDEEVKAAEERYVELLQREGVISAEQADNALNRE